MGLPGRDPRQDHQGRRLFAMACNLWVLLCHRWSRLGPEAVKDALQESLVEWYAMPRVPPLTEDQLRGWLRTTAEHLLHRESLRGTPYLDRLEGFVPPADDEARVQQRVLVREILERCLAVRTTGRTERSVVMWMQGYTSEEISRAVGITPDNARQKVSRGLESLRVGVGAGEAPGDDPEVPETP